MTSLGGFLPSFLFPVSAVGVRALLPQERQGVQLVQQSHHPGSRLRFDWHLQLCHPVEGPFPHQVELESHRAVAGAQAGCRLPRFHFVLPLRLLDARHNRLVTYNSDNQKMALPPFMTWKFPSFQFGRSHQSGNHTRRKRRRRQQRVLQLGGGRHSFRLQHHRLRPDDVQVHIRHPTTTEWHDLTFAL